MFASSRANYHVKSGAVAFDERRDLLDWIGTIRVCDHYRVVLSAGYAIFERTSVPYIMRVGDDFCSRRSSEIAGPIRRTVVNKHDFERLEACAGEYQPK